MRLGDIDLDRIVPDFMQEDVCIKALNATLEPLVKELAGKMRGLSIWADLDNLTDEELDEIAYEMDIPWYNKTYDRKRKIRIIREGEKLVKKMGTPYVLEYVIQDIFGSCTLSESGIDYEGEPHKFTITVNSGVNLNQTSYGRFVYLLNKIKRASSWVDSVESNYLAECKNVQSAVLIHRIEDKIESDNLGRIEWPTVGIRQAVGLSEVDIYSVNYELDSIESVESQSVGIRHTVGLSQVDIYSLS